MAFLDLPYRHDLFVSCHPGKDLRQIDWTKFLFDELRNEVKSDATEMVGFSHLLGWDEANIASLRANFSDTPSASGVILIILTEQFLRSPWCGEEAHWFEEQLKKNRDNGGRSIVLVCDPALKEELPKSLSELSTPVLFYSNTDESGRISNPKPLGFPHPTNNDTSFWREMSSLATLVINHLRKIKQNSKYREEKAQSPIISAASESVKVYLHAKATHIEAWENVKGQLEDSGCAVFPERLKPIGTGLMEMERAREERLRILKEEANAACALVVDPPTEHDIHMLVSDRTALRVSGKNIPCALIDRTGSDDPFAQRLGIQTVNAVQQDWTTSFQDWLKTNIHAG
nr:hypothetical protein [Hyphomonas sp. Mor2]